MANVERTEVYDVDIEKLYNIITDYEKYPEFVEGSAGAKVHSKTDTEAEVTFSVNMIKSFSYIMKLTQKKPTHVKWEFVSGEVFKSNEGEWILSDLGSGKTEVTYKLEVEFKGFVPQMLIKKLVSNSLPNMMQSYVDRANNN